MSLHTDPRDRPIVHMPCRRCGQEFRRTHRSQLFCRRPICVRDRYREHYRHYNGTDKGVTRRNRYRANKRSQTP